MLSFAYPWLLIGLLGLTLPLAAHLIYSQQSQYLRFSSIRLITPTKTPQTHRKTITDPLLLLLRLLIIICVTLAIAGLEWIPAGTTYLNRESVILLDLSASMNTPEKQEQAKALVEDLIEDEDGLVGLVTYGKQTNSVATLTSEKPTLVKALNDVVPTLEEGNPHQAIQTAVKLYAAGASEKRLLIISDFQSSDWQRVSNNLKDRSISFSLHRVGDEARDNQAVLSIETSELSKNSLRVSTSLINYGENDEHRTVQLSVAGKMYEKSTQLLPGQIKQLFFEVPKTQSGKATVSIVEDDGYPIDNTLYFWLTQPPPTKVTVVTPASALQRSRDEAKFLRAALLSRSEYEWQRFSVADASDLQSSLLQTDNTDILIVAGLPNDITPALGGELRQFLLGGGIVLATTGNGMAETLRQLNHFNLLSAQFMGAGSKTPGDKSPFRLSALDPGSPIQPVFSGLASNDLMLTRIYKFSKIKLLEPAVVIAKLDGDYPLIIDKMIGNGHLIFATIRMDLRWSDLPLRPSFVPLIKELVLPYIDISEHPSLTVNQLWINDNRRFSAKAPGLYIEQGERIAVNVSRLESIPENLTSATITEILGGTSSREANHHVKLIDRGELSHPLWQWLILAAVLFLILESLLIRFGSAPEATNPGESP